MRFSLLLSLFLSTGAACADPSAADEAADCERLRDHTIELSLSAATGEGGAELSEDVRAAHRAQLAAAATSHAAHCGDLTAGELECRLAARSLAGLSACAGGSR